MARKYLLLHCFTDREYLLLLRILQTPLWYFTRAEADPAQGALGHFLSHTAL